MNCPECGNELEILSRNGKEIYVCPACLSGLMQDESSAKVLKYFCTQEIMDKLISAILDDSLFDNAKTMLLAKKDLACPKCKSYMRHYDFNRKIRFYVNKCITCGAIWLNPMQMPLLSIALIENTPEDLAFKNTVTALYDVLAKKKARRVRPFDEVIAPFAVITGLAPAIPLGDNMLTKTKPIATGGLIIACAAGFVLQVAFKDVVTSFGLYAGKTTQGQWHRLITYAFLHGGIAHLAGNMFFLRLFGRTMEDELGWKKYLSLFILGSVVSGIFFMATASKKDIPCVGASGAISAIMGAYLILFPKARLRFNLIHPFTLQKITATEISSSYYILSWIIMNLFFGMLSSGGKTTGIAYWGHIGGFIAGVIFIEAHKNLKRG